MKTIGLAPDNNSTRCRFWIATFTMALALTCHAANSSRCRSWMASLAMALALTGHVAAAEQNLKSDKMPEKSDRTSLVDITIETSRSQPTAGDGLGVSAEIKNVSDSVIQVEGQQIVLILPPELEGPGKSSYGAWSLLPTEPAGPKDNPWKASIYLNPGDTYKVYWTQGVSRLPPEELDRQFYLRRIYNVISAEMNYVFFPPGDYKIAVVCKYTPVIDLKPDAKPVTPRTTVQTAIIHVAAPQFVILFGAALGGLLAYFILPQARAKLVRTVAANERERSIVLRITDRIVKELAGIAGAVLLSAMITILLSRIAETQFLIKITITDVWGAIAIGFIANYAGAKALDKILGGSTGNSKTATATHKAAPPHHE